MKYKSIVDTSNHSSISDFVIQAQWIISHFKLKVVDNMDNCIAKINIQSL